MKYSFEYDQHRNLIRVMMRDFWTPDTVREFAAAAGIKAHEVRAIRDDYDVLVDTRAFPVQSNEVADLLPTVANAGLALTSGRTASVVGSYLNKLQAERTQTHPRFGIFLTMAAAEAWLDGPSPGPVT